MSGRHVELLGDAGVTGASTGEWMSVPGAGRGPVSVLVDAHATTWGSVQVAVETRQNGGGEVERFTVSAANDGNWLDLVVGSQVRAVTTGTGGTAVKATLSF